MKCDCCGKVVAKTTRQWWFLGGYFGLSGHFCHVCYAKVAHDGFGKPKNPKAYARIKQAMSTKPAV